MRTVDFTHAILSTSEPALHAVELSSQALSHRQLQNDDDENSGITVTKLALVAPGRLLVAGDTYQPTNGYTMHELIVGAALDGTSIETFSPSGSSIFTHGAAVQGVGAVEGRGFVGLYNNETSTGGAVTSYVLPGLGSSAMHTVGDLRATALFGGSYGLLVFCSIGDGGDNFSSVAISATGHTVLGGFAGRLYVRP